MNGQKKKILLVEDDMALSAVYRSRLEIEGFDVREANNGEDALSATVEYRPDLILLDDRGQLLRQWLMTAQTAKVSMRF